MKATKRLPTAASFVAVKVLMICVLFAVVLVGVRAQEAMSGSSGDHEESKSLARFDHAIDSNSQQMVCGGPADLSLRHLR